MVMLLGSGEVSRELTLSFQRLGATVVAVDRYADAPAHRMIPQRCYFCQGLKRQQHFFPLSLTLAK